MHRAQHDEEHGRQQHAAIELVNLRLDFLLPQRQRNREDRVAVLDANRRGGDEILERCRRFRARRTTGGHRG